MNTKLNKTDITLLVLFYVIRIIFGTIDYQQRNALTIEYWVDFSSEIVLTVALLYTFVFWLIPNYIVKESKYFQFLIYGITIMFILGILHYTIGYWSGENDWSKFPKGYRLFIRGVGHSYENMGFLFGLILTKKFYESQNMIVDIQKEQKENELKLLRSQLNPHFLFNNLNTLDALIDKNPTIAKEYINRLSLIYRYLIKTKDSEVMELSSEIDFSENYIYLIQTRFGDDYQFSIQINSSIEDKFIPTGAIQTLLENVVKHNKVLGENKVETSIDVNEEWLTINNTKTNHASNNDSLGTGLINLKSRYRILTDKKILIQETDTEYKITIPIINLTK